MPNQKQPIDLIIAKGKKHLTQNEIETRKNTEVKPLTDNIEAPDWLTKKQKSEFDEYARQLSAIGIMSETDCDTLARYVVASELYVKMSKQLLKKEVLDDPYMTEQIMKNQDKAFKQCHTLASSLGMTITARCKLVVPKVEEDEKPKNKFIKFTEGAG